MWAFPSCQQSCALTIPLQVGYHNEHHDFPSVPWTRLPALRALAPEFYDTIPSHPSWPMIIVNFIRDKEVGIFARAKRLGKGSPLGPDALAKNLTGAACAGAAKEGEVGSESEERMSEEESDKSE